MNVAPLPSSITVEGVELEMEIGIAPSELGRTQRLLVDVTVQVPRSMTDLEDSMEGLGHGFDYGRVVHAIRLAATQKTHLLETLANRIRDAVLAMPGAQSCTVRVCKLRPWAHVTQTSVTVHGP